MKNGHRPCHSHDILRLLLFLAWTGLLAAGAIFSFAPDLYAGEIRLVVKNQTRALERQISSEFHIANEGNEPAWDVSLEVTFLDQRQYLSVKKKLPPAAAAVAPVSLSMPADRPGSYPIFALLKYSDGAGRRFSNAVLAVAADAGYPDAAVVVTTGHAGDFNQAPLRVDVAGLPEAVAKAALVCHGPEEITVAPRAQEIKLRNGRGGAEFNLAASPSVLPGSRYQLYIAVAYEQEGLSRLAATGLTVPVDELPRVSGKRTSFDKRWLLPVFALLLLAGALWRRRRSGRVKHWEVIPAFGKRPEVFLDLLVLAAVEVFIMAQLSPAELLRPTIATGGDMASHYYTLVYLVQELLPRGQLTGWTPGNYAGFPILQFYFPLPFLIMAFLGIFFPLPVAFKLGTLAGPALLPAAMYLMLRLLRCPFPGPAFGAVLALPFLFNNGQSMWGGNLLSTLAGEFAYSLSLSLALLLLGSLYRGCRENRHVLLNAALVFLVGFSHGYTLIFVAAASLFFLLTTRGFFRRLWYLCRVYTLGFLLLAFWLVPLLVYMKFATPFHTAWVINSLREIAPPILLPVYAAAVFGVALLVLGLSAGRNNPRIIELIKLILPAAGLPVFAGLVCVFLFVSAPGLGVIDIRYLPCAQLMLCLLAGMTMGWLGKMIRPPALAAVYLLVLLAAALGWVNGRTGAVPVWAQWNYEGFEGKYGWPLFRQLNRALAGTFQDPRVFYEHAAGHNIFGSVRAFESLPLFSGRATLEGLYLQASPNAPFVFYLQSELSREQSCPFRQYFCATMDYGRARRHLEMFNVRELILKSREAKAAVRRYPGYRLLMTQDEYELWEFTGSPHRYVVPLAYQPALYVGQDWKNDVYRWFTSEGAADIYWVAASEDGWWSFMPGRHRHDNGLETRRFPLMIDARQASSPSVFAGREKIPIDTVNCRIRETIRNEEILIETNWLDKPLLIKMSYHPRWQVEGADQIYLASPALMLIYPRQERVRLYYGAGWPDRAGFVLTAAGLLIVCLVLAFRKRKPAGGGAGSEKPFKHRKMLRALRALSLSRAARRRLLAGGIIAGGLCFLGIGWHSYAHDPQRWFNEAVRLRDVRRFEEARFLFQKVLSEVPDVSALAADSLYHLGITYYLDSKPAAAIPAFAAVARRYPRGNWAPEAQYHLGLCHFHQGRVREGVTQMRQVIALYPYSVWADYARQRLQEHGAGDDEYRR